MRNLFCHWNRIGLKEEKVKLSDYKESEPMFIDANIFIDYSLPNPKYGGVVADFLESINLSCLQAKMDTI